VVLPASICAIIPMFLTLSKGITCAIFTKNKIIKNAKKIAISNTLIINYLAFSRQFFIILIIIQKAPLIDKIINGNLNLKEY